MKTIAVFALLLCGSALIFHKNNTTIDPTGKATIEQIKALNGGTMPETGLIADPSGTIALKMAQQASLAQGN